MPAGRPGGHIALYSAFMDSHRIFSIVLAAGQSRRFGATKQLARYSGETLVERALRLAVGVTGDNTVLVVGADWLRVLQACQPMRGFLVRNERYAEGLSTSIAAAVGSVLGIADAVLILLADQPLVGEAQLLDLTARWRENPGRIVASRYSGRLGPPAVVPARLFPELMSLVGDQGARDLINSPEESAIAVDCEAAAVDIDTPEALRSLD